MADSHTRYVKSGGCASQDFYKGRLVWCNGARNHDGRHWSVARPVTKKVPKPPIKYWTSPEASWKNVKKVASFGGEIVKSFTAAAGAAVVVGQSVEDVNKAIISYKTAYSKPIVPYTILAEDITVSPDFYDAEDNLDYNTVTITMTVPVIYGPPPEKKHDIFTYTTHLPMYTDLWTPFDVVGLLRDETAKMLKEKYKDGLVIAWSEAQLAKSPSIIGVSDLVKYTMTVPFEYY